MKDRNRRYWGKKCVFCKEEFPVLWKSELSFNFLYHQSNKKQMNDIIIMMIYGTYAVLTWLLITYSYVKWKSFQLLPFTVSYPDKIMESNKMFYEIIFKIHLLPIFSSFRWFHLKFICVFECSPSYVSRLQRKRIAFN